jgi:hypothetical protein
MVDLARARDLRLELLDLRPHREDAAVEDLLDLRQLGGADVGPPETDVRPTVAGRHATAG